jgi:NAD/NADP transhydrogenase alpha subunit
MIVGILKEPEIESRVVLLPEQVLALGKIGIKSQVETGAGLRAFVSDEDYTAVGADVVSRNECIVNADLLLGIHPIKVEELSGLKQSRYYFGI